MAHNACVRGMVFGVLRTPLYSIPLGSPTCPSKRSYVHVPVTRATVGSVLPSWCTPGPWDGWGLAGWVYRVGNTTGPACQGPLPQGPQIPAKRAPEALQGRAGVGGYLGTVPVDPFARPALHPPWHCQGPVGAPAGPLPGAGPASPSRRARFHYILLKVSQNGQVSPNILEKACHSPCFQTGPGIHLLKFSDSCFGQPSLTRN